MTEELEQVPTTPVTVEPCDLTCRGEQILAGVTVPLPAGWRVSIEPGQPGLVGFADPQTQVVHLLVRNGWSDDAMRFVLLHEYAHVYDFTLLNDRQRTRWMRQRGVMRPSWYPTCHGSLSCNDRASPSGDWAESFAYCYTGQADQFESHLAGLPDDADCDLLAEFARLRPAP